MTRLCLAMCTRGRPEKALRFVERLRTLSIPAGQDIRLIFVDNNDEATLRGDVDAAAGDFAVDYVHEPRKGLSRARNAAQRALDEGETAILVDDDAVLPVDFLNDVLRSLDRFPDAGLIGGRIELHDAGDLPIVIKRTPIVQRMSFDEEIFGFVHGCCMVVRPEARRRVPLFDERLGAGSITQSGEDIDYAYAVWKAGLPVIYDPDLWVAHDHGRRTLDEYEGMKRGWEISKGAVFAKHILRGDVGMLRYFLWKLRHDFGRRAQPDRAPEPLQRSFGFYENYGLRLVGVWLLLRATLARG